MNALAGRIGPVDVLERLSRVATLFALLAAAATAVVALLLAVAWVRLPFPGVLVEHTLLVTRHDGPGWSGRAAGLTWPQRIVRIGGFPVESAEDYHEVLSQRAVGDTVPVFAVMPDGGASLVPAVRLGTFSLGDTLRLFGLPYLVGLAYLAIGVWVYRVRGGTRPGRVLAFFCFCTATVCTAMFDLTTTHLLTGIWTVAIAMTAGAILSLAMRFPEEWTPVRRRAWLLAVPYLVSGLVAAQALGVLAMPSTPWSYIDAWGLAYRYNALAIVVFLAVMVHRARAGRSAVARQQARIVLVGSALSFLPVTLWFLAPLLGWSIAFDPVLFLPTLLLFPLSLWVAIVRYRLLDMDVFVSRTLLYGALTAVLAGVYTISITISQKLFTAVTGEGSDAAIVLTTLIVVSAVTPLKNRLQALIDRELKGAPANTRALEEFGAQVRLIGQAAEAEVLARRFLQEAVQDLQADSGALSLERDGHWRTVHTVGRWTGLAWMAVPLEWEGRRCGVLSLGPRRKNRPYTADEADRLLRIGGDVARAMRHAEAGRNGAVQATV